MKFKVKAKDYQLMVRAKASLGENIDEAALSLFSRLYLRGFLKPKLLRKNLVEYSGPVGISLYERLKRPLTQRDFLLIMEQVIAAVQKAESNKLCLDNMILDIRYVFINDVTKEIQFLYVPMTGQQRAANVAAFMEAIVYSVVPDNEKVADVVSRFVYCLKNEKSFVAERLEKFIALEDRSVVNTIKKKNSGKSGFMTNKPQHYYEHYAGDQSAPEQPTDVLEEDEATGLLEEEDEATGLLEEEDEATGILNDEEEDGTTLLSEEESIHFPSLYRVLTGETISINKPVFRIGKERSYVDYFVTNNSAVSRSHADVITRGKSFFVIDLNSKNHTYINNSPIPVQSEVEIHNGDHLKLGNEEFIFNV